MPNTDMSNLVNVLRTLADHLDAGPPVQRRATQAAKVTQRRVSRWTDLGAPNGYISVCGQGRVLWTGRRWIATINGVRVGRTYNSSRAARRACGGYLYRQAA